MSVLLNHLFKSIHQIIGTGSGGAECAAAPRVFFYGQRFKCWEYKKKHIIIYYIFTLEYLGFDYEKRFYYVWVIQ